MVRVSGLQAELARVVDEAERAGATLVGRAALGLSWLALDADDDDAAVAAIGELRARLAPRPCVVLDAPAAVREALDVWDERDPARLALAKRVKERFDPGRTLRPGVFVGGHLMAVARAFDDVRPPSPDLIDDCVHCGFCLETCPTYALWDEEMDSPRGRIVLMRAGLEEGSELSAELVTHIDHCLGCMACVTACPSGVQYDKLIEDTRAQVERNTERRARRSPLPALRVRELHPPGAAARARAAARRRPPARPRPARRQQPRARPLPAPARACRAHARGRRCASSLRPLPRAFSPRAARRGGGSRCSRAACSACSFAT